MEKHTKYKKYMYKLIYLLNRTSFGCKE